MRRMDLPRLAISRPVLLVAGLLLASLSLMAARPGDLLLDGGGFPTPTPTETPIPTPVPSETPTLIPLDALFPTETPTPLFPYPQGLSPGSSNLQAQGAQTQGPSSPSLLLLAAPFVLAFLVLLVLVNGMLRRTRGG